MSRRCEPACFHSVARRVRRRCSRTALGRPAWLVAVALLIIPGCRTANYTASDLPEPLRMAPMPATYGINLQQMAGADAGTSQLWPGDLVEITIVSGTGDEKLVPVPARVSTDGTVMVPLIGPVTVSGLEPSAAERQIAAAAVERGIYRQPYVTLQVSEQAVNRVTVMGAVEEPGVVELPRGASDLLSALAAAGGLKADASTQVDLLRQHGSRQLAGSPRPQNSMSPDGVQLASYNGPSASLFSPPGQVNTPGSPPEWPPRNPEAARIDLAQAGGATSGNVKLGDRDVVMVHPREKRVIHVTGLVTKPDQFELPPDKDVRVLDAIALAGGLKSPLADKVFVIRQLPDMPEPAVVRVSLSSAKKNGDENLILAPGDLVSVEATMSTMIVDTATNFFRVAVGLSGNIVTF